MNPFADMIIDLCPRLTRYQRRRAIRDGLSRGEIRALERFGDEPFSWE